jgi:prepilin-type N-terminal cleavage/methylation domain-containing protein
MKDAYKQKREQGFTIIEVLIVLAIAALILLIVFLAVPALQRNSRNTSRRADVSNMLASINEYASNNNGQTPASIDATGLTTIKWGAAASTQSETKVNYYTKGAGTSAGDVDYHTTTPAGTTSLTNDAAHDYVAIYIGGQCNGTSIQPGGARAVAALYLIENGSNAWASQCLAS